MALTLVQLDGIPGPFKVVAGTVTTASASDSVATGLNKILSIQLTMASDLDDDLVAATAAIPTDGTFTLKTWKNAGATDGTPVAATTFSKDINVLVVGY